MWLASLSILSALGRPPATVSVTARGNVDLFVGTTFGALVSHDAGATWHWYCEQAVGIGGQYDPVYNMSASGSVFATTFNGERVLRDACTFAATTLGTTFVSASTIGPDHTVYVAASDPSDVKIYASTNDGTTFPTSASPGAANDWWQSIVVAPSDSQRVYLSGYAIANTAKTFKLFASTNGGTSFSPLPVTDFTTSNYSTLELVGVAPDAPDVVYAHVSLETGTDTDRLYRSDDGGAHWTKIYVSNDPQGPLVTAVRGNGDLVAGSKGTRISVSHDRGATWIEQPCGPHPSCLVESEGQLYACAQEAVDGFALERTGDLATWTGLLRFVDIIGPVDCPTGSVQHDTCPGVWAEVQPNLTAPPAPAACPSAPDAGVPPDADTFTHHEPTGCCSSSDGRGSALLAGVVAFVGFGRRRRATRYTRSGAPAASCRD